MGEVHQLIIREGLESARSRAETRAERLAVEAAGIVLAEEVTRLGITHAGFAMTSLLHRRIEDPLWRRQGVNRLRRRTPVEMPQTLWFHS